MNIKRLLKRCMTLTLAVLLAGGSLSGIVAHAKSPTPITDPKISTYDCYRYMVGVPKTLPDKKKAKKGEAASIHFSIGIPKDIIVSAYIKDLNGNRVSKKTVKFTDTKKDTEKKIAYKAGEGEKGRKYCPSIMVEIGSKCTYLDFSVYFTP